MTTAAIYDRAAALFGLACIAHCVALPVLAVAVPFVAVFTDSQWVHWVFTVLAVAASGSVIASASDARRPAFVIPAAIGLAFIIFGVFAENFGVDETYPTVLGGTVLAAAHIYRLFKQG